MRRGRHDDIIAVVTAQSETGPDHVGQKEVTMCRNLSKYAFIFLFLALSGLIFLLRNIHTVEVRKEVGYTLVLTDACFSTTLKGKWIY